MKKRMSERMFREDLLERANKVRSRNVRGDFFHREEGNIYCRICETEIVMNGRLLSSYRNVEFEWDFGDSPHAAKHRTNMCQNCAKQFSQNDPELMEAILMSDFESWARSDEGNGHTKAEHERRFKLLHDHKLKLGKKKIILPGKGVE